MRHRDPGQRTALLPGGKYTARDREGLEQGEMPSGHFAPAPEEKAPHLHQQELHPIRRYFPHPIRQGKGQVEHLARDEGGGGEGGDRSAEGLSAQSPASVCQDLLQGDKEPHQSGGHPGTQQPGGDADLRVRRPERVEEKYRADETFICNITLIML